MPQACRLVFVTSRWSSLPAAKIDESKIAICSVCGDVLSKSLDLGPREVNTGSRLDYYTISSRAAALGVRWQAAGVMSAAALKVALSFSASLFYIHRDPTAFGKEKVGGWKGTRKCTGGTGHAHGPPDESHFFSYFAISLPRPRMQKSSYCVETWAVPWRKHLQVQPGYSVQPTATLERAARVAPGAGFQEYGRGCASRGVPRAKTPRTRTHD